MGDRHEFAHVRSHSSIHGSSGLVLDECLPYRSATIDASSVVSVALSGRLDAKSAPLACD
jgi:hypothetical protein